MLYHSTDLDNLPSYFPPPPASTDESTSPSAPQGTEASDSTKGKGKDLEPAQEEEKEGEGESKEEEETEKPKKGLKRSQSKSSPRKQGKETHPVKDKMWGVGDEDERRTDTRWEKEV